MVTIKDVRDSNATFKAIATPGMVAVFGATSGIGMGTLKAFVKYANAPKAYIIGRSESAAGRLVNDLRLSNPSATLCFLEGESSLIREVDRLCDEVKSKEEEVDFVFLSAGCLSFDELSEGIEIPQSLPGAFEELAKSSPRISFIHKYPGFVDTGAVGRLMSSTTEFYAILATFLD
ncbi:11563773-c1e8-47f6-86cf-e76ea6000a46-CDS [Sclerotinia trifoliorum]|uniref:11563773-c1e8-47f6-86cf-e76ea6000a46-CDS n=1 Tax=Sclerotinia trifoliorum TaxID=28548 RepID=A0A8H2VLC4_9HELO|nr:11563773-c1e8-47f6-86cf-e76ea6000a46-CDS [Sclerotinia trifoliorum]